MAGIVVESLALVALSASLFAPPADTVEGVHYRVYRSDGTPSSFAELVDEARSVDVLLIGETHDDPIAHALEFELLRAMDERASVDRDVALSLEMFEADVQYIVDEYLDGYISEAHFKRSSRPWGNYDSDYRPSVEYAREQGLPVIAANAPRRYVTRVTREGAESLADLPEKARSYLPPLPYAQASEAYRDQWNALMMESMAEMQAAQDSARAANPPPPDSAHPAANRVPADSTAPATGTVSHSTSDGMGNALQSQSLWDATMAYRIARHLTDVPHSLVVHFVGAFHVETGTGIPEQLQLYRPGTSDLIVSIRPHGSIDSFDADEFAGLGDYVILTDESLPRTRR